MHLESLKTQSVPPRHVQAGTWGGTRQVTAIGRLVRTDKCDRRGVGLPEWSCCHTAAAASGFLGVGSTVGRVLRGEEEMGQN